MCHNGEQDVLALLKAAEGSDVEMINVYNRDYLLAAPSRRA
jgi:hypothetical protein